jgi:hypothetical protein
MLGSLNRDFVILEGEFSALCVGISVILYLIYD